MDDFHFLQFVEQIFRYVLSMQNIEYSSDKTCEMTKEFANWYAILYTFGRMFTYMSKEAKEHIFGVASYLEDFRYCMTYVDNLAKRIFERSEFSWNYFRMLMAYILAVSNFLYRKGYPSVAEELLIHFARHIMKHFQAGVKDLGGWKALEKDCVQFADRFDNKEIWISREASEERLVPCGVCLFDCKKNAIREYWTERRWLQNESRHSGIYPCNLSVKAKILSKYEYSEMILQRKCFLATYVIQVSRWVLCEMRSANIEIWIKKTKRKLNIT